MMDSFGAPGPSSFPKLHRSKDSMGQTKADSTFEEGNWNNQQRLHIYPGKCLIQPAQWGYVASQTSVTSGAFPQAIKPSSSKS